MYYDDGEQRIPAQGVVDPNLGERKSFRFKRISPREPSQSVWEVETENLYEAVQFAKRKIGPGIFQVEQGDRRICTLHVVDSSTWWIEPADRPGTSRP